MNVPTQCLSCGKTLSNDDAYMNHLMSVHGTTSPDEAMRVNSSVSINTPRPGPQVIGEGIPPTSEMLEVIQQAEKEMAAIKTSPDEEEAVGAKGLSEEDKRKMREMGLPEEVPADKPKEKKPVDKTAQLQPLILDYQYSGQCKKCGANVDTLMVKAKGDLFAIAFCPSDRKQVKSIKVEKINNADVELAEEVRK